MLFVMFPCVCGSKLKKEQTNEKSTTSKSTKSRWHVTVCTKLKTKLCLAYSWDSICLLFETIH